MYLLAYPVYTALLCPRALFDEKKRKREEALGAEERHEVGRPKRGGGDISYGRGKLLLDEMKDKGALFWPQEIRVGGFYH